MRADAELRGLQAVGVLGREGLGGTGVLWQIQNDVFQMLLFKHLTKESLSFHVVPYVNSCWP